ncbi:hypothetical protein, partial [Ciceribacter ferrooxidans]|uniref:hypothetical protein n=1 Tax=Ciceribacter ferrooxidans TaxID=2509717 RepID=UPI00196A343C
RCLMSLRWIILLLSGSLLLSACVTSDNPEQPYMGNHPNQDNVAGTDLYNANKNVQKHQSNAWGWMSNQN